MLDRDFLYSETNEVTNRETMVDISVPSLVWNRSFLVPRRPKFDRRVPDTSGNSGRRLTLLEVRSAVDGAILNFLRGEASFRVEPSIDTAIVLFAGVYDGRSIAPGATAEVVAASAITIDHQRLLEADERALVLHGRYEDAGVKYEIAIKVHMRTNLFTVSTVATPEDRTAGFPALADKQDFDRLTIDFWDRFSAHVLKSYAMRRDLARKSLQGIFADSRGIIVPSTMVGGTRQAFDPAVCWAEPVVKYLAPILSPLDEHSCTATYMLDRRAMSLTTFGSQQPTPASQGRSPLTFVICVHADLLRQHERSWARLMGHVMSRSHTITTMRLASLLDLKLLRRASIELARVDDLKQRARDLISLFDNDEVEGGPAHRAVDDLRKHLGDINSGFLEANAAGIGLTFRIESSRYYIEEFKKNVEALHLTPIEGYQSYAQAIDKTAGIIFEFISRLGVRYDRLVVEMAGIERSFSTVQTRHTGNQIAELQRNGELILVGILVPYYTIQIVAHVFGGPEGTNKVEDFKWRMINAAIFTSCAFFAVFRHTIARKKPTTLRRPPAQIAFGLKTFAAFLVATTLLCLLVR